MATIEVPQKKNGDINSSIAPSCSTADMLVSAPAVQACVSDKHGFTDCPAKPLDNLVCMLQIYECLLGVAKQPSGLMQAEHVLTLDA
jgi:hypothetical protein